MAALLSILFPIFGLILAGALARRLDLLGPAAASELNRFVVWLALPALLFRAVAHSHWSEFWQPGFLGSFGLATLLTFVGVLAWRLKQGRPLADAGVDALAASYSNTGFVGIPLCLMVFGAGGQAPAMIATLLVVCVLFSLGVIAVELGLQRKARPLILARKIVASLLRNPLVVAPLLGVLMATLAVPVPVGLDKLLEMLAGAASPCALVCVGLFLARRPEPSAQACEPAPSPTPVGSAQVQMPAGAEPRAPAFRLTAGLTLVKLVLLPTLTLVLARCFQLGPQMEKMGLLLAALPTGTGPFMLAEFYRREAAVTSQTILWTTALSVATLAVLLSV